jgi:hypothetical protein
MNKKGIVPKTAPTGYCAGTVEENWNEGKKGHDKNDVVEIAPSPEVHDRESSHPSLGPGRKKSAIHGNEYPGRSYETQTVKDAEAKPVSREIINRQLGTSRRLGN